MESEQIQEKHYDRIAEEYEKHYNDKYGRRYYWKFLCEPLLDKINLAGKKVLDGMCGSGEMTSYLLSRGAVVTGLDISNKVIEMYQDKWKLCRGVQGSICRTKFEDNSFDVVVVAAGLHHVQPDINKAILEIHRILKPGGDFFFIEPHKNSMYESFREIWYAKDNLFEENEESIDLNFLKKTFVNKFQFIKNKYAGNIAYFFVWNSLIFRIPLKAKKYYSPLLILIESILDPLMFKWNSTLVECHWKKELF